MLAQVFAPGAHDVQLDQPPVDFAVPEQPPLHRPGAPPGPADVRHRHQERRLVLRRYVYLTSTTTGPAAGSGSTVSCGSSQ